MRRPEAILWFALLSGGCGMASADPIDLKPFKASYVADWKGMAAATSTVELLRSSDETYTYSSVNSARGLFRRAFPDELTQTSTFKLTNGRVVPLRFQGTD
jgi:hypothetical protein